MLGAIRGHQGCIGVASGLGAPITLGPSPGSQHSHWFPWGSDLPGQGQASDRNELCRLLYTFGIIFCGSFHIYIYATSSHILKHTIKKCYMDYFLCRPIYIYPYTINLTYYNTIVLIMKNYFFSSNILAGAFFYMSNLFGVEVVQRFMVEWGMGGISAMGICAFFSM